MALINCPECTKQVSDKANSCPNCGYPISSQSAEILKQKAITNLKCPEFPKDMDIGRQIVNWAGDAAISGHFDSSYNDITALNTGNVNVLLHKNGISIQGRGFLSFENMSPLKIHKSQLINLKSITEKELIEKSKSVIGRAVLGGIIFGPLGALVGGISGIGKKSKNVDRTFMIINYWNIETKIPQSILISGELFQIQPFIERVFTDFNIDDQIYDKEMEVQALPNEIRCPKCGIVFPKKNEFCPKCNAKNEEYEW